MKNEDIIVGAPEKVAIETNKTAMQKQNIISR